jgi:anti-sigma regulatory factor (Ser/Thr protein kinase)
VQALAAPAHACVEAGLLIDGGRDVANHGCPNRLSLTVSIRAIFRLAIANAFVMAINRRMPLCPETRERIHTALHEVLLNAVMHGHLQLDAALRDSLGGFGASHDIISARLDGDEFSQPRVAIDAQWTERRLIITVHDNGVGFEPGKVNTAKRRGSGRGLLILEAFCDSVTHLNGGRSITLGFDL